MKKFYSKSGKISYLVQGEGSVNFFLIHNAGGSHEMMNLSTAHFSKKGRVVVPDLLGHGASDSPRVEYTVNSFADSLIQLCNHEKINKIVLIGLNYGANVAIEMAKISPALVSHLVLIEPPIYMEPWIVKVVEEQIKELENPSTEWAQETVDSVIIQASEQEREIALKAIKMTPSFVKASTYKHLLMWDKGHSFGCSISTLIIQTEQPFCREERARTNFSNLHVGRVVGSGPWANLEVPVQVHSMIDRFLEIY